MRITLAKWPMRVHLAFFGGEDAMLPTLGFKREQSGVVVGMAAALGMSILVLGGVAALDRASVPVPFIDRLRFTLRAEVFVVAWLVVAIANVARVRFFSEQDIAGGSAGTGSEELRAAGAILQNTFEQVVLAIVTHLIVAASFSRSASTIVTLVCLFAIGRLLFWSGYRYGARGRAFGFALSFYPSVLALWVSLSAIVVGWPS